MARVVDLSRGEFRIMNIIWENKGNIRWTQANIMKVSNSTLERKLNVSTYATYLRRMLKKGFLVKIDHNDGHPTYEPRITYEEYFQKRVQCFHEDWNNTAFMKMAINYLSKASYDEKSACLNSLRKLIPELSGTVEFPEFDKE